MDNPQTTQVGAVTDVVICGVKLPMVKIAARTWIIRDGLKYIPMADTSRGSDLFVTEGAV